MASRCTTALGVPLEPEVRIMLLSRAGSSMQSPSSTASSWVKSSRSGCQLPDLACRPAGPDGEQGRQLGLPRQWKGRVERAEDDAAAHAGPGQQQVGQGAAHHGGEAITGLQARLPQLLA